MIDSKGRGLAPPSSRKQKWGCAAPEELMPPAAPEARPVLEYLTVKQGGREEGRGGREQRVVRLDRGEREKASNVGEPELK